MALDASSRDTVINAIRFWDRKTIDLDAAVVMSNHVHLVLRLREGTLSQVLKSIKSFTSRRIPHAIGGLWQDENFDHILRTEEDWIAKVDYVRSNPVKSGLSSTPEPYNWLYIFAGTT